MPSGLVRSDLMSYFLNRKLQLSRTRMTTHFTNSRTPVSHPLNIFKIGIVTGDAVLAFRVNPQKISGQRPSEKGV